MRTIKFTEGPWSVEKKTGDVVAEDGDFEICTFTRSDDIQQREDSFLIAAAPDLYAKVVELHSYLIEEDQNYMGSQAYLETKALISKFTVEPTQ
jgi:hypothetical protein